MKWRQTNQSYLCSPVGLFHLLQRLYFIFKVLQFQIKIYFIWLQRIMWLAASSPGARAAASSQMLGRCVHTAMRSLYTEAAARVRAPGEGARLLIRFLRVKTFISFVTSQWFNRYIWLIVPWQRHWHRDFFLGEF